MQKAGTSKETTGIIQIRFDLSMRALLVFRLLRISDCQLADNEAY